MVGAGTTALNLSLNGWWPLHTSTVVWVSSRSSLHIFQETINPILFINHTSSLCTWVCIYSSVKWLLITSVWGCDKCERVSSMWIPNWKSTDYKWANTDVIQHSQPVAEGRAGCIDMNGWFRSHNAYCSYIWTLLHQHWLVSQLVFICGPVSKGISSGWAELQSEESGDHWWVWDGTVLWISLTSWTWLCLT